jgi:hypothetical protein
MAWAPAAIGAGAALYGALDKNDPVAPDYKATAEEQAQQSKNLAALQARLNRADVNTPGYSVDWTEQTEANPEYDQLKQAWEQNRLTNAAGTWGAKNSSLADFEAFAAQQGISPTNTTGWEQEITLSPEQQAIYEAQSATALGRQKLAQSLLPQATDALGKNINYAALPAAGGSLSARNLQTELDYSGLSGLSSGDESRNRAEQAIYGRATSRLDPQWQEQESELRTRLYNQGLREGDAAFDAEMRKFGTAKTDAYQTAMTEAITGGGAEASRTFGMDLARRQQEVGEEQAAAEFMNRAAAQGLSQDQAISAYQNALRQNALEEEQGKRVQSINEMNALQSGQQVSIPGIQNASTASAGETPNLLGAAGSQYAANLQQYGIDQAQLNQLLASLGGLYSYL